MFNIFVMSASVRVVMCAFDMINKKATYLLTYVWLLWFRPGGIPARNFRGERLLLYIGVIDILQSYRLAKKLEHAMKSIVYDGVGICVV